MNSLYNEINAEPQLPRRRLTVELIQGPQYINGSWQGKPETVARLEGIQAEFRVTKISNCVQANASIRIANLTKEHIQLFSTFCPEHQARLQGRRLRLYAGFEGKDYCLMYEGDIVQALPTMPPDIFLECECISGYYENFTLRTFSIKNDFATYKDIAELAAAAFKTPLDFRAKNPDRTFRNFYFEGNLTQFLKQYNQLGSATAWYDHGNLIVDNFAPETGEPAATVDMRSGLVGTVKPTPTGISFTTVLMPQFQLGQSIKVISNLIPNASGIYRPHTLVHRGNLRGDEWFTDFTAYGNNYSQKG